MRGPLPKLFIAGECPGIIALEFMADQVLNLRSYPRLGGDSRAFSNGFASFRNSPVENDREKRELNLFGEADLLSKMGL